MRYIKKLKQDINIYNEYRIKEKSMKGNNE